MFEKYTYEYHIDDMLARVSDEIDKREGSIIYDTLSPTAVKFSETYIDLDLILDEVFPDTASRPYLIQHCQTRGIAPTPATSAIVKCEFNMDVPIGSRFSFDKWNFVITEKIDNYHFKAQCEDTGPISGKGDMIPIEYIEGLEYARLTEILINGEDVEETEALRERYFRSFDAQAYGGNRADYREKVPQLQDIGNIKIKRVTETDKNIYLTIVNSTFDGASEELVRTTQEAVDPVEHSGEGYGIAPILHKVKVLGVKPKAINIETKIFFQRDFTFEDMKSQLEKALDEYFLELNKTWSDGVTLVVRIAQIETRLLGLDGVLDIADTKINGVASNLVLGYDEIAKRGELTNAKV